MNQIRFTIGVPKAGSAARIAEDSSDSPTRSIRPRAGSAARDAEERKRAEGSTVQRGASIGMRATAGRVMGPAAIPPASPPIAATSVVTQRSQPGDNFRMSATSNSNAPAVATLHPERGTTGATSQTPLQTAAVRLKSLVQSLFSPGDSTSKS